MHKIRPDESGEGERALDDFVGIVGQTQQQKGDEGYGNLNANRIFGGSQEVADFQSLFDPSKEQLDSPSTLVQIGDFLRARGQIIGQDAQHLAGVDYDLDLAHETRHRISAGRGEPFGKVSGPIAPDRRSRWDRSILDDLKGRIGLEARNDAAARPIKRRPPAIVVIAEVKNVGGTGLDGHLLGGGDVIDVGSGHHEVERLVGIGIVDDVRFGAANSCRKRRPIAAQFAQLYAGRVDQTDTIADFAPIPALQLTNQSRKQTREDFRRTRSIGARERRLRNRAAAEMIKLAGMALQACGDVPQTPRAGKLRVQHRNQVGFGLQATRVMIGTVLIHKPIDDRPRNMLQKSVKNDILVLHGFDLLSGPDDSQPTEPE